MSSNAPAEGFKLFQTDFAPEEFAARRGRVFDAIGEGAVALIAGSTPTGGFDADRQTNEFYYLCGVEVPHAYLLLAGRERKSTVFLPRRDPRGERSEGPSLAADDTQLIPELTGLDAVGEPEALAGQLKDANVIYLPQAPGEGSRQSRDTLRERTRRAGEDPWDERTPREGCLLARLNARCPRAEIRNLSPILDAMRVHKSPQEVELMRRAGELTAQAAIEAMRIARPGVWEYQIAAAGEYVYRVNGARGEGYSPIIAGGRNIWYGHYHRNDARLRDGDLLLVDCAPDFGYYTSDIGRMIPVSGAYNDWQRELYGFIVAYHKVLLRWIRPGETADKIMEEAAEEMRPVVDNTRWSKPHYEAAARKTLAFKGHLSHGVGMAVHDVGRYRAAPLAPGVVFALDPQMWIPEEQKYIRVEDTVLVTEDGIENLTGLAPLELDDVEATMKETGLLEKLPPQPWAT